MQYIIDGLPPKNSDIIPVVLLSSLIGAIFATITLFLMKFLLGWP